VLEREPLFDPRVLVLYFALLLVRDNHAFFATLRLLELSREREELASEAHFSAQFFGPVREIEVFWHKFVGVKFQKQFERDANLIWSILLASGPHPDLLLELQRQLEWLE